MSPDQFHADAVAIQQVAAEVIGRIDRLTAKFERDRFWRRITLGLLTLALVWVGPVDAHSDCVRANESRAAIRQGITTALTEAIVVTASTPAEREQAIGFVREISEAVARDIPSRDCGWLTLT